MVQAELCFLDSPRGLILADELVVAGPEGTQRHTSDLLDSTGMSEQRMLEHLCY